ncbi:uncharacterized protein, DUF933 [Desulfococcus multivorans]|nr:uncharacterized protein, DUF933 [Desulfococcus multivorans]
MNFYVITGVRLQSSVFSLQSSVFSLRSSVFGLQPSVFSLRSSVFGLQSSAFGSVFCLPYRFSEYMLTAPQKSRYLYGNYVRNDNDTTFDVRDGEGITAENWRLKRGSERRSSRMHPAALPPPAHECRKLK